MILAGGRSSRMGRDKATIEIAGIPLLRRIYDVVNSCHARFLTPSDQSTSMATYIVTPWVSQYQSMLPTSCQFIAEQDPHQGPLFGFVQGLEQITSTWVLLLACDLPNLSAPIVQSWIDNLVNLPDDSIAYLPKQVNTHGTKMLMPDAVEGNQLGWEPLCGFYRRSCLESLTAYISTGDRSFQGWLRHQIVTELEILEPTLLFNCNTPADLAVVRGNPTGRYGGIGK
jgi:molybdenum cofactor guanylyltransferase